MSKTDNKKDHDEGDKARTNREGSVHPIVEGPHIGGEGELL